MIAERVSGEKRGHGGTRTVRTAARGSRFGAVPGNRWAVRLQYAGRYGCRRHSRGEPERPRHLATERRRARLGDGHGSAQLPISVRRRAQQRRTGRLRQAGSYRRYADRRLSRRTACPLGTLGRGAVAAQPAPGHRAYFRLRPNRRTRLRRPSLLRRHRSGLFRLHGDERLRRPAAAPGVSPGIRLLRWIHGLQPAALRRSTAPRQPAKARA